MTHRDNYYEIERFAERVSWMARHLRHSDKCNNPPNTFASVKDCIEALGHRVGDKRTWQRYGSGETSVPHTVVRGLIDLFPDLTEDLVICDAYADFEHKADSLTKSHSRWNAAMECMAKERATLAAVAKRYYTAAGVDEAPDFPLVMRKEWFLPKPVVMTPTSPDVTFALGNPAPRTANLDGITVEYIHLKSRKTLRQPFNGDCYRLMNVRRMNDNLVFDFQNTTYFDYVNTCEILGVELADQFLSEAVGNNVQDASPWVPDVSTLPRRGNPQRIFDFNNRAAFVGVNCLLMLRNHSEGDAGRRSNKFYFHHRDEKTLEAQNTLHVVPAGGHQPCEEAFGNDLDVSLWRTAVREFCEELFDKQDVIKAKRDRIDFLERKEVLAQIKAFIHSNAAQFYLLGIGLDPLTTKPEVLVAIVVDWPKARMAGGKGDLAMPGNYEGKAIPKDLSRKALKEILEHPHPNKPWLPAGRACIELALQHYDLLMGDNA